MKKTPVKPEEGTSAGGGSEAGAGSAPVPGSAGDAMRRANPAASTPVGLPYHEYFTPPPANYCAAPLTAATAGLDAALVAAKSASEADAARWQRELFLRWKGLRPANPRIFGAHPTQQPDTCPSCCPLVSPMLLVSLAVLGGEGVMNW